jgi:hypothetical protein
VLDALDLLQGFIDGGFVGQQGVGDIEVAFLTMVGTRFNAR